MTTFGKMGSFSKEERPLVGKAVNAVKVAFEAAFAEKEEVLKRDALLQSMESESWMSACLAEPCAGSSAPDQPYFA